MSNSEPPSSPGFLKEQRCGCGALLARVVAGRLEIKCKRCKRVALFSLEQLRLIPSSE